MIAEVRDCHVVLPYVKNMKMHFITPYVPNSKFKLHRMCKFCRTYELQYTVFSGQSLLKQNFLFDLEKLIEHSSSAVIVVSCNLTLVLHLYQELRYFLLIIIMNWWTIVYSKNSNKTQKWLKWTRIKSSTIS